MVQQAHHAWLVPVLTGPWPANAAASFRGAVVGGNKRIGWSEADKFLRHGVRRRAIHDLQSWPRQYRGRPACADHDGIGGQRRNWSVYIQTSPMTAGWCGYGECPAHHRRPILCSWQNWWARRERGQSLGRRPCDPSFGPSCPDACGLDGCCRGRRSARRRDCPEPCSFYRSCCKPLLVVFCLMFPWRPCSARFRFRESA